MMNLEYFHNILRAENFTRDGDALISMDQRVKIILCPEGGLDPITMAFGGKKLNTRTMTTS